MNPFLQKKLLPIVITDYRQSALYWILINGGSNRPPVLINTENMNSNFD